MIVERGHPDNESVVTALEVGVPPHRADDAMDNDHAAHADEISDEEMDLDEMLDDLSEEGDDDQ